LLEIQSTPILHIDISDETKQEQLINSSYVDELKMNHSNNTKKVSLLESDLKSCMDENTALKMELSRMNEELMNKDKYMNVITSDFMSKEEQHIGKIKELSIMLEEKNLNMKSLSDQCEKIEKEMTDLVRKYY
jgi:septation ring formation regulator EzrA